MRILISFRGLALGLALAAPLAASAHAAIEDTIWRDQADTYQTTQIAQAQIAKGPSAKASDAGSARVNVVRHSQELDGAGLPVNGATGEELPGYTLGGF